MFVIGVVWALSSPAPRYLAQKLGVVLLLLPVASAALALIASGRQRATVVSKLWSGGVALLATSLFAIGTLQICVSRRYSIAVTQQWHHHPQYVAPVRRIEASRYLMNLSRQNPSITTANYSSHYERLTGLLCDRYPATTDTDKLIDHLRKHDYVIDDGFALDVRCLRPALQQLKDEFVKCAEFTEATGRVVIYRNDQRIGSADGNM